MYNPPLNTHGYREDQYTSHNGQAPPEWAPGFEPEPSYSQSWYQQQKDTHSPSTSFGGAPHSQPHGYPPQASVSQSGMSSTTYASPFTPETPQHHQDIRTRTPDLSAMASTASGSKKQKTGLPVKKKRKKLAVETDGVASTGSPPGDADKEKRMKTGRACDACVSTGVVKLLLKQVSFQRTKKIRCDILHVDSPSAIEGQPLCAHCKQYELECTFFLPITETRFKKRRAGEVGLRLQR